MLVRVETTSSLPPTPSGNEDGKDAPTPLGTEDEEKEEEEEEEEDAEQNEQYHYMNFRKEADVCVRVRVTGRGPRGNKGGRPSGCPTEPDV